MNRVVGALNLKGFKNLILASGLLIFAGSANALLIDPADTTADCSGPGTGNDANWIAEYCNDPGQMGGLNDIYKANVDDGNEEGDLLGSYDTMFTNTAMEPENALINHVVGTSSVDMTENAWLLVKDGNQEPGRYAFDLNDLGWNGTDALDLRNFWPNEGAISNVSLWGSVASNVPEPGSLALFGLGLLSLGWIRRRQQA